MFRTALLRLISHSVCQQYATGFYPRPRVLQSAHVAVLPRVRQGSASTTVLIRETWLMNASDMTRAWMVATIMLVALPVSAHDGPERHPMGDEWRDHQAMVRAIQSEVEGVQRVVDSATSEIETIGRTAAETENVARSRSKRSSTCARNPKAYSPTLSADLP